MLSNSLNELLVLLFTFAIIQAGIELIWPFFLRRAVFLGVTLNTLLGRKGSLEKMKDYWDVGFYLGANILTNGHRKVIEASEKLYKLKAPVW